MGEPQRYRQFSNDELQESDDRSSSPPPPLPPRNPTNVYRIPPRPHLVPSPQPEAPPRPPLVPSPEPEAPPLPPKMPLPRSISPPPPPLPARKYSRSFTNQPFEESVSKQTSELHISEGKPTGTKPKERPAHRSFSFDQVPENRAEDFHSPPKAKEPPPSPSMSPSYRNVPERTKVSLNPAGRSSPGSPSSQSPSPQAVKVTPKKGMMKGWFSKAKDFVTRKNYAPLESDKVVEDKVKTPSKKRDKSKKYYQLDEEESPKKPVKIRTYKRVPKELFPMVPETASGRESENVDTGEKGASASASTAAFASKDLMDFNYTEPELKPETYPGVAFDRTSDRESDFESSDEYETATETGAAAPVRVIKTTTESDGSVRVVKTSTETGKTTSFTLRPDLCRIQVNSPADIRVAYSYSGAFTTCISYETTTPTPSASASSPSTSQDPQSDVPETEPKSDKK